MISETLKELREEYHREFGIPEGATHVSETGMYYKNVGDKWYCFFVVLRGWSKSGNRKMRHSTLVKL